MRTERCHHGQGKTHVVCALYQGNGASWVGRAIAYDIKGDGWRNCCHTSLYAGASLGFAHPHTVALEPKEWWSWAPAVMGLLNISQPSLYVSFEVKIQSSLNQKKKKSGENKCKGVEEGRERRNQGKGFKTEQKEKSLNLTTPPHLN